MECSYRGERYWIFLLRMDIHEYILLFLSFLQKRKFEFPLKTTTYNVLVEQHLRKRRKYRERKYLWQKDLNFTYPKSRRSLTFPHNARKNRTSDAIYIYIYRDEIAGRNLSNLALNFGDIKRQKFPIAGTRSPRFERYGELDSGFHSFIFFEERENLLHDSTQ